MDIVYPYGCRHPDSMKGSWDGALVVAKEGDHLVIGRFEQGMDFVGHVNNPYDAYQMYANYRDDGWLPMDDKDIFQTAGLVVKRNVPWHVCTAFIVLGFCCAWKVFC